MQQVVIIGAGGQARSTLSFFDAINAQQPTYDVQGFIVEAPYGAPGTMVNDKPILGGLEWFTEQRRRDVQAVCAIGAPEVRRRIVKQARALGIRFCTVIHPTAVLSRWVTIGEGTIITPGVVMTQRIQIGAHVYLNLSCTIGHDSVIEDYVNVQPGAHVSGNVHLGEGCVIGVGANIIEKKTVGAWSIVGAGSTIIQDVPPNTTVVGSPGRIVKTRPEGWHLA